MKAAQAGLALALADRDSTVRFQAIVGLSDVGPSAAPLLRAALIKEPDAVNQAVLAEALGNLADPLAAPILTAIVGDAARTEAVRSAALAALSQSRDPQALRARFSLLYDPKAPAEPGRAATPGPGPLGFLALQRPGLVSGTSGPLGSRCRALELERQEITTR